MRILIVKTSSLGDVIHTLPALTELRHQTAFKAHWVVEKNFSEVLNWHPYVERVIPIELRKWRKKPFSLSTIREWRAFKKSLNEYEYDITIDAQGLMKSAFLTCQAVCLEKYGLDWKSAWEPLASLCYKNTVSVDPSLHAVTRMRHLFAKVFEYTPADIWLDYGIDKEKLISTYDASKKEYIVLCHGTTWATKEWPETYWKELANLISAQGLGVLLPFGNQKEEERAKRIASQCVGAEVLPKMSLTSIAGIISKAKGIVAVDTGLGHLSAALGVPCVSLYGPTDPVFTGAVGMNQEHLIERMACSPCLKDVCHFKGNSTVFPACFEKLTPQRVLKQLQGLIS